MAYSTFLTDISEIKTGHTFRGKIEAFEGGTISVFQPKDLEAGAIIGEPIKVHETQVSVIHKHLLKTNDILLANKGTRFSTFIYKGEPSRAIASSSFFVIRPDTSKVIPEYVQWHLGQQEVIDFLKKSTVGSTIPSLTLTTTASISLTIPPISMQKKIVEMVSLVKKEEEQLNLLIKTRKEFLEAFCWEQIQNEE